MEQTHTEHVRVKVEERRFWSQVNEAWPSRGLRVRVHEISSRRFATESNRGVRGRIQHGSLVNRADIKQQDNPREVQNT